MRPRHALPAMLLVFGIHVATLACTCGPNPPVAEAVAEAAVVFLGRAVFRTQTDWPVHEGEMWPGYAWTFDIERAWKGNISTRMSIVTGTGRGDCGYLFMPDRDYIVYAYESDGILYAHLCTRTIAIDHPDAKAELEALDALQIVYIPKPAALWPTATVLTLAAFFVGVALTVVYHRMRKRPRTS